MSCVIHQNTLDSRLKTYPQVMANQLTADHKEECISIFRLFDKDGNGKITARELGLMMGALGQNPTRKELTDLIKSVDTNGNGVIDLDEFLTIMSYKDANGPVGPLSDAQIQNAFRAIDKDDNGFISPDELPSLLESVGIAVSDGLVERFMHCSDTDADGKISYEEFKKILTE